MSANLKTVAKTVYSYWPAAKERTKKSRMKTMDKYITPHSDVVFLNDISNSSVPTPGENEGDIIPWVTGTP